MIMTEYRVRKIVQDAVDKLMSAQLLKLTPDKSYILVLPEDMDSQAIKSALHDLGDIGVRLAVVQASKVTLLEIA